MKKDRSFRIQFFLNRILYINNEFFSISPFMVHFLVASLKGELFYEEQCHVPKRNPISGLINLALFFSKTSYFLIWSILVNEHCLIIKASRDWEMSLDLFSV